MEISSVNFIHLLDLTTKNATIYTVCPLTGIEPAIPVQRSNQLSYRGHAVVELDEVIRMDLSPYN